MTGIARIEEAIIVREAADECEPAHGKTPIMTHWKLLYRRRSIIDGYIDEWHFLSVIPACAGMTTVVH